MTRETAKGLMQDKKEWTVEKHSVVKLQTQRVKLANITCEVEHLNERSWQTFHAKIQNNL